MNRTNLFVLGAVAAFCVATAQPAYASLKGGVSAFLDGDYDKVVKEFKKVMKKKRQPRKAQLIMARMYIDGLGVPVNYSRAYQYLLPAAKKNDAWAQTQLGHLYAAGDGPMQSFLTANEYYLKAAKVGYAPAQLALGNAHLNGFGSRKDNVIGYAWINLAATGLKAKARDEAITLRDKTAKLMSASEVERAQEQSLHWSDNIEIVDSETAEMMRKAREGPPAGTYNITVSMFGEELEFKSKSESLATEIKKAGDKISPGIDKELKKKAAKPAVTATKTPAKKSASKKPAPGATAGKSAEAEEGFVASIISTITGAVSSVFELFFGSDEPAKPKAPIAKPVKTPA